MTKEQRLETVKDILLTAETPVSGSELARKMHVSRQVIVQDIALLRAQKLDIIATNRGYRIQKPQQTMVVQVCHEAEEIEAELNAIVDCGASVENVFVEHATYGKLEAPLKIHSRREIQQFLEQIRQGKNEPLTRLTHGVHFHTIQAPSSEILQAVEEALDKLGFLC